MLLRKSRFSLHFCISVCKFSFSCLSICILHLLFVPCEILPCRLLWKSRFPWHFCICISYWFRRILSLSSSGQSTARIRIDRRGAADATMHRDAHAPANGTSLSPPIGPPRNTHPRIHYWRLPDDGRVLKCARLEWRDVKSPFGIIPILCELFIYARAEINWNIKRPANLTASKLLQNRGRYTIKFWSFTAEGLRTRTHWWTLGGGGGKNSVTLMSSIKRNPWTKSSLNQKADFLTTTEQTNIKHEFR